jgi:tetratricopeptide (TPR) repeat protein
VHTAAAQKDRKNKPEGKPLSVQLREAEFYFTEAEKYFILEDYAKALIFFQRSAGLNPDNATIHYKIAEVLSRGNKPDDLVKASLSIEAALRLERKNKYFYLLASGIYNGLSQFSKSAEILEQMIGEIPGTEEHLYDLAAIYQYDKRPAEAIKVYDRAEAVFGVNEVSSVNKLRIYLGQEKVNEAIAEADKLIENFPDEEEYVLGVAESLSQGGQPNRAVPYVEKYVSLHPESGGAKMLLAGLYRDTQQEEKARKLIMEVAVDESLEVESKVLMLGVYVQQLSEQTAKGSVDDSLRDFVQRFHQALTKAHPSEPMVFLIGGDLYMALKKSEEARNAYLSAIRLGANSFEAWQNLLFIESEQDELDSLILHSEQGLELYPSQGILYYFNGYAHLRKKMYKEAAHALEQAKKMSSANPSLVQEINSMLGEVYNGMREYQKSDKAYEEVLTSNPSNYLVLNNYSYYLALRKEHLDKAEAMASKAVKADPENASYLDTYAWVLFMRGKYKDARRQIEKALQSNNTEATLFEHYGDILFQLGEVDEAIRQWQRAKTLTNDHELIDKKIANRRLY